MLYVCALKSLCVVDSFCRRYIGTMGGGMDQTISCVAKKNKAAYITFNPLNAVPVTLPEDAVFVIANCLRMSAKAETASKCPYKQFAL